MRGKSRLSTASTEGGKAFYCPFGYGECEDAQECVYPRRCPGGSPDPIEERTYPLWAALAIGVIAWSVSVVLTACVLSLFGGLR